MLAPMPASVLVLVLVLALAPVARAGAVRVAVDAVLVAAIRGTPRARITTWRV